MFFIGRVKRQNRMNEVCDPLVHKINLMLPALLKSQVNEDPTLPDEALMFSMWMVYLAFSTSKPNPSRKESQSLNDAYNQILL